MFNNISVAYLVPGNIILYCNKPQIVLTKPTQGLGEYTSYWLFQTLNLKTSIRISSHMVMSGSYFKVLC